MRYYYLDQFNQPIGPVAITELLQLKTKGVVHGTTFVAPEGSTTWVPFASLPEARTARRVSPLWIILGVGVGFAILVLVGGVIIPLLSRALRPSPPGRASPAGTPLLTSSNRSGQTPRTIGGVEPTYNGSGFVVTPEGHVLTCAHVVAGAGRIVARIHLQDHEAQVLAMDQTQDLALLKLAPGNFPNLPLEEQHSPNAGDAVTAFGRFLDDYWGTDVIRIEGRMRELEKRSPQPLLHLNMPLNPGFSGGPVVNEHGAVVGLFNAKLTGPNIFVGSFAIPADTAAAFLKKSGVAYTPNRSQGQFEDATLQKRIKPAVALIKVTPAIKSSAFWRAPKPPMVWKKSIPYRGLSCAMTLSPDGKLLAISRELLIDLVQSSDGKVLRTLTGHRGPVQCVRFSSDGRLLASGAAPNSILVWDTATGMMQQELVGKTVQPSSRAEHLEMWRVAFSPDGRLLAGLSKATAYMTFDAVHVWNLQNHRLQWAVNPGIDCAGGIQFEPDGQRLLVSGRTITSTTGLCMIDADTGKVLKRWSPRLTAAQVKRSTGMMSALLSPRGDLIAFDSPGLSYGTGDLCLASHPDGVFLARTAELRPIQMEFSRDQSILVASHSVALTMRGLAICEVSSATEVWNLVGDGDGKIFCIAPDGRHIYRFSPIHSALELWDISSLYGPKPAWLDSKP